MGPDGQSNQPLKPRVALVSGFWGQNIGNAFFNLGGAEVLGRAGFDVRFIQDMPAYATFRNESRGNFKNAFPLVRHLEYDLLVLQGPLFTKNFGNIWAAELAELDRRGIKWAVLGGAFRKYTSDEVEVARHVMTASPPLFVSTRDRTSFEMLQPLDVPYRSGIDSAFFLPEAVTPWTTTTSLITLAFDHYGEPTLSEDNSGPIAIGGQNYSILPDRRSDWAADRSKAHAVAYQTLQRRRRLPELINGLHVVRPDHRTNPHLPFKIYRDANGIASDEPWTYLAVYANSSLTISDRVHACVATLAYGNEALLHNPGTKRSALFDAVNLPDIAGSPQRLDQELRQQQLEATVAFLRTASHSVGVG